MSPILLYCIRIWPEVEDSNDNGSKGEHSVTGFEGGSSNAEEKKRLDEAMKKIQNQKTHALYCPKCTLNITETAQLLEKGKETYPYNQKTFVVWIPLVIPFSLPWFPLNPPGKPYILLFMYIWWWRRHLIYIYICLIYRASQNPPRLILLVILWFIYIWRWRHFVFVLFKMLKWLMFLDL